MGGAHWRLPLRIYDFAGYSDTLILLASFAGSILVTGAIVGVELSWKEAFDQNLIGTSHTYVYMGMQVVSLSQQLKRNITFNLQACTLSFIRPLTKSK